MSNQRMRALGRPRMKHSSVGLGVTMPIFRKQVIKNSQSASRRFSIPESSPFAIDPECGLTGKGARLPWGRAATDQRESADTRGQLVCGE